MSEKKGKIAMKQTAENLTDSDIVLQFFNSSILYYLCAESTATGPITDPAQYRYT
jgi:hypothetical protein